MKPKLKRLRARLFGAVALGIGWSFSMALARTDAAAEDSLAAPARTSTRFTQIGAKAAKDYRGNGLGVIPTSSGARLRSVSQGLEGEATSEGLWLTSIATSMVKDCFGVSACSVGRASGSFQPSGLRAAKPAEDGTPNELLPRTATVQVVDNMVRFTRPGLVGEYTVSMDGVRQDFLVLERPDGAGELSVRLAVNGAEVEPAACGARLVLESSGHKIAYGRLRVTDATGREPSARMEVMEEGAWRSRCLDRAESACLGESLDAAEQTTLKRPESGRAFAALWRGAKAEDRAPDLAVLVKDAEAVYPVRIDPTISDANWSTMNPPGPARTVYEMVVDGSGNLYIGSEFTFVGAVFANRIAKGDGQSWTRRGPGLAALTSIHQYARWWCWAASCTLEARPPRRATAQPGPSPNGTGARGPRWGRGRAYF